MHIYHIVVPASWNLQEDEELYTHDSLESESFIHCSFKDQIEGVLGRYYAGAERVLILHIDPELLTSKLVVEPSTGGELYPHIYGKINRDSVVEIEERDV